MKNNPLTVQAHERVAGILQSGDIAIDATAGNGNDTFSLAKHVGVNGKVYAFDIQQQAITNTKQLLHKHKVVNVTLYHISHDEMPVYLPEDVIGKVRVVMFNLGYLPGSNKNVITEKETTLQALNSACEIIISGGLITVLAYPGHPGGKEESDALTQWLQRLPEDKFRYEIIQGINPDEKSPRLVCLYKLKS